MYTSREICKKTFKCVLLNFYTVLKYNHLLSDRIEDNNNNIKWITSN